MENRHHSVTHGMSRTPEWEAWRAMLKRCYNPNMHNYERYGGRGITVCDRWRESFANFFEDLGRRPSNRHSLNRIDNNGNYEPGNCEWATAKTQCNNRGKRRRGIVRPFRQPRQGLHALNFKDMTGEVFGRWTVISFHGRIQNRNGNAVWVCRCDCGTERPVKASSLRSGISRSCGCLQREFASGLGRASRKHGMTGTPEYRAWNQLIQRCTNPKLRNYADYGGRGIKVCARWLESFANFYADVGQRPGPAYSLDRIDNDGDYCPENCRWATDPEQRDNSRHPRRFIYKGESLSMAEISRRSGIPYGALQARLTILGWDVERATTQSPDEYHGKGGRKDEV